MFRPEEMSRVDVLVLRKDLRAAVTELGRLGCAHLIPARTAERADLLKALEIEDRRTAAEALLARVVSLGDRLGLIPADGRRREQALTVEQVKAGLSAVESRVGGMLDERDKTNQRVGEMQHQIEDLSLLAPLPARAFAPERLAFTTIRVGWLKPEQADKLAREADFALIVRVAEQKDREMIAAVVPRKKRFALETLLEKLNFVAHEAPSVKGIEPAEAVKRMKMERLTLLKNLDELEMRITHIAGEVGDEIASYDYSLRTEIALCKAMENFGETRLATVAAGWAPTSQAERLKEKMLAATDGRAVIKTKRVRYNDPAYKSIPVKARLNAFFMPFRLLVATYGLPTYGEIEPTPLFAISFLLMFGIMFGDLGQGAVILVLGILVRRFSRKEWARDFGFVLGACGVVAMLFGAVVYGSFFSREGVLPKVPGVTTTLLQIGGTENTSIIRLFIGTVALGIILMSVGIIINIINNFGRRGFYHGMLDKFGLVGLVFYWGALGILLLRGSSIILAGIFIILPLVLLFVAEPLRHLASRKQETHGEGLGMKFVESGVDTMETVMMYLANTVSFLRLAGFALAHAGLSLAMWMIFAALSDMPVVGWAVVVLGNIVIIGLEGLVAGIQSIRLEYYEFFTKFLRGEGKAFEPFRLAANSEK